VACQPIPDDQVHAGHGYLEHLEDCPPCRARHDAVARMLDDARRAAELDAEDAFPLIRLGLQRDRILARVDDLCHAGKVLTFPSAQPRSVPAQPSHRTRWVAAAAAAGLVVGLLGGHLTRDFSSRPTVHGRRPAPAGASLRPARPLPSEDELLGQVEVAFEGTGPSALRTLDALTPVTWDVR
jgi:hypothetical protein